MRDVMNGYLQSRDTDVKKDEILKTIKENREKHIAEYKEAVEGYKEAAIEAIENAVDKLKKRINDLEDGEVLELAAIQFDLPVPRDHSQSYDLIIGQLELDINDVVKIRTDEYACFIEDQWDWKPAFMAINSRYKK